MKVVIFKSGNIGTAPILELLLDELADRKDITVRTVTTGSKMDVEAIKDTINTIFEFTPDLVLFTSPNTSAPGPSKARKILSERGVPTVIFTDGPGKRVKAEIEEQGLGYIIIMGDPLIGARKEFLDPVEMAIFNANVISVLASTGAFRLVFQEVDKLISAVKSSSEPSLPRIILDTDHIMEAPFFKNPYAKVKAMAAYELLKKVAEINLKACFIEKNRDKYVPLVACAHEITQASAQLAEEAREIEKSNDSVLRTPHAKDGKLKERILGLILPPKAKKEYPSAPPK